MASTGIICSVSLAADGDKSASQERVFAELEEDLSESIGTSLPTDLTLTTTFAEARDDDEDTDENQNKVCMEYMGSLELNISVGEGGAI
jgi:hypothetical protein